MSVHVRATRTSWVYSVAMKKEPLANGDIVCLPFAWVSPCNVYLEITDVLAMTTATKNTVSKLALH